MPSGFILHPTYYLEKGRAVIHLFGKLESGDTFVVRDDRLRPHFFVRTAEIPAVLRLARPEIADTARTTPKGEPVSRIVLHLPGEVSPLRQRLEAVGIKTYEADIPFATLFLLESGLRGALRIEGEAKPGRLVRQIFHNPKCHPAELSPRLEVLSLDIETDPEAQEIFSVALWGESLREVLVVCPPERRGGGASGEAAPVGLGSENEGIDNVPAVVRYFDHEEALLRGFHRRMREVDPDVITGWNVIDFDLRILQSRFDAYHIPFQIGRADLPCRLLIDQGAWGTSRAIVPGRVVLDGLSLLRSTSQRLADYRLETAAREILGQGKSITAEDRGEEILRLYHQDLPAFLRYNLNDARLVWEILERRSLLALTVRQSLQTGMPLDRTGASIASFDFLYLSELHRRGMVAPTVEANRPVTATSGGFVLSTRPGIFDQVAVLDYRSLYPSLIRTFRLDPLSLIPVDQRTSGQPPIGAPNGARFLREGGILPEILDRLFPLREQLLAQGDDLGASALKILMNSFYGVLATPRCRFYSPETANAITSFGQQTLLWTQEACEARGHRVLYGDTDSIFVETGAETTAEAEATAARLAKEIDAALAIKLRAEHGVESRLHLRFDRLFSRLFLPALRGSQESSKKRYAGLVGEGANEEIIFVGLESVRRDWTDLAKLFQKELIRRIFRRDPMEGFIRDFLARLRAGDYDALLVYHKALRKPESEYTRTTPPHVQAARRLRRGSGRIMRYVMTSHGPEPAEEREHPIDREHYVEKQLRPVAESVLSVAGLTWEGITGGQGSLPF